MTKNAFVLLTALSSVFLVQAQAQRAQTPLVQEGITVQLGEHTWTIPDQNVGMVPNVGIVVGDRATLVIDPGLGRINGEAVLREVAKIADDTELYVASTHFHPEHTVGYVAFPDSAQYVNSRTQEQEFAENGMAFVERFAGFSDFNADALSDAERRVADITFDREYTLDLGGVSVRFTVVGPTHTRGDTGFFVEEDNVLFAGDVVMNNSFVSANAGSSISAWLAAFDTFEALGPTTIVPAHGPIGGGDLIPQLRDIIERIQGRTLALREQGVSMDEAVSMVQSEFQAEHPDWPRANGISSLARSAWLEAE